MCSIFVPIMDNYQGDLTDIIRASGGAYGTTCSTGTSSSSPQPPPPPLNPHDNHWQQFSSDPLTFSSVLEDHRGGGGGNYFGDPFSTMRDPFLQELDMPPSNSYFNSTTTTTTSAVGTFGVGVSSGNNNTNNTSSSCSSSSTCVFAHKVVEDEIMRRPCKNIFSNMIQISPNAKLPYHDSPAIAPSPRAIKPSSVVVSPNSKDCLMDNTQVQISSPRNPALKRRKNQAKKVVCIPAPAAANSRQTGEVVPSDLWAWRKYGQKPIKGSPYPRGYYRCSSSKGCSARKQVERSRTDPNMLVITYTSEHNHPWPTQRNALAGSTRSQPSKNNAASGSSKNTSEASQKGTTKPKEEQQESNSEGNNSPVVAGNSGNSVKEEMEDIEKQLEMEDGEFSDGLPYKPSMMESNQSSEDFFAELGEIEADPLNLLFSQGFGDQRDQSKALDPFHLFDWSGDNHNNTNSLEEPNKRRL